MRFSTSLMKFSAFVLSYALTVAPLQAQTHVITTLGGTPLLGTLSSRAQLQSAALSLRDRFHAAARELGLNEKDFRELQAGLGSARYVVVPRHLDAMAWYSGGTRVTSDVIIPPDTRGWEVDIRHAGKLVRVFIPAICGNLSILRENMPRLARKPKIGTGVAAYAVSASTERAVAPAHPATATLPPTTPSPAGAHPSQTTPPTPVVVGIHPPPAATHAHRFPWFIIPLILPLLFSGGGSHGSTPAVAPPPPSPAPPTPCPGR